MNGYAPGFMPEYLYLSRRNDRVFGHRMDFPRRGSPVTFRVLLSIIGTRRLVRHGSLGCVFVNRIVEHPTIKLYCLTFNVFPYGSQHFLIVRIIQAESLFPTWRKFHNDILAQVANLAGFSNDIDMYVA